MYKCCIVGITLWIFEDLLFFDGIVLWINVLIYDICYCWRQVIFVMLHKKLIDVLNYLQALKSERSNCLREILNPHADSLKK